MSSEEGSKTHYRDVFLRRDSTGWSLYSDKGFRLTEPVKYDVKSEAVEWAYAWCSSFTWIKLVIEDEHKES